jgi:two-component system chemotaxis sensor kinase CheA
MPRLNGLELARSIHADPRFADLPIIALTSLAGEDDIARGQAAGVNDYQIKMDKEKLLMSVRKYVARSLNLVKNEPGHNAEQTVYSTDL